MKRNKKQDNTLVIVLTVVLVFLLLGTLSGFGMMGFGGIGNMMQGYWNMGFGTMWLFGPIFMILIIVALVLSIAWLVKQLQGANNDRNYNK